MARIPSSEVERIRGEIELVRVVEASGMELRVVEASGMELKPHGAKDLIGHCQTF